MTRDHFAQRSKMASNRCSCSIITLASSPLHHHNYIELHHHPCIGACLKRLQPHVEALSSCTQRARDRHTQTASHKRQTSNHKLQATSHQPELHIYIFIAAQAQLPLPATKMRVRRVTCDV